MFHKLQLYTSIFVRRCIRIIYRAYVLCHHLTFSRIKNTESFSLTVQGYFIHLSPNGKKTNKKKTPLQAHSGLLSCDKLQTERSLKNHLELIIPKAALLMKLCN